MGNLLTNLFFAMLIMEMVSSCTYDKSDEPQPEVPEVCDTLNVSYSTDIMPIIMFNCAISFGCHVSGGSAPGDFMSYADLKAKADNGTLKNRVVVSKNMPPTYSEGPTALADSSIQKIDCWIKDGALKN